MPVLSPAAKAQYRVIFDQQIHNLVTSVHKIKTVEQTSENPYFQAPANITEFDTYNTFRCSAFDMLSGKVNRLFGERDPHELVAELGLANKRVMVVNYVPGLELAAGVPNNLAVGEEVQLENEWWRVQVVIPDSEGVQHTALCAK